MLQIFPPVSVSLKAREKLSTGTKSYGLVVFAQYCCWSLCEVTSCRKSAMPLRAGSWKPCTHQENSHAH